MSRENNGRFENRQKSLDARADLLHYDPKNIITGYVLEAGKNEHYLPDHSREVRRAQQVFFKYPKVKKYATV